MEGMYRYALDCIKAAYPKANFSRDYSPSRGQFQIFVTGLDGKEIETYNKNKKDGPFSDSTALLALERIKKIIES